MSRRASAFWLAALLLLAIDQAAAEPWASVRVGVGVDVVRNISAAGIGTGERFGADTDGAIADTTVNDETPSVALGLHLRRGAWLLGVEANWRYRMDWDVRANTFSLGAVTNVYSNTETLATFAQARREFGAGARWRWFVGGGVGLARHSTQAEHIERARLGIPERRVRGDRRNRAAAWHLGAGATRALRGDWLWTLEYRFSHFGDVRSGPFPERAARLDADYTSHELAVSWQRRLNRWP
ncbi:MAG: outer membrane beta-barrel protein [Pseudomonadota bacterium]